MLIIEMYYPWHPFRNNESSILPVSTLKAPVELFQYIINKALVSSISAPASPPSPKLPALLFPSCLGGDLKTPISHLLSSHYPFLRGGPFSFLKMTFNHTPPHSFLSIFFWILLHNLFFLKFLITLFLLLHILCLKTCPNHCLHPIFIGEKKSLIFFFSSYLSLAVTTKCLERVLYTLCL